MNNLVLSNLTKCYGDVVVLNSLSFSFTSGIYGILGANGAGKSTMMNLITDNLKRDDGSILWNGTDILELGGAFRKEIGYMPQQQGFYEHMTANTFLHYMAELKGIPKKQARAEIDELLEVTNLLGVRHKKLAEFSGGMLQRALLAQALLGQPDILLLDEPTAGLDPKERIRIRNFISSISRERIVLLSTHIVSDIESIADEILLMKKGNLITHGSCNELLSSVRGKVRELPCEADMLAQMQERYKIGNIFQRSGETWVRVIGDELPDGEPCSDDRLSLEDVYLYYLGD